MLILSSSNSIEALEDDKLKMHGTYLHILSNKIICIYLHFKNIKACKEQVILRIYKQLIWWETNLFDTIRRSAVSKHLCQTTVVKTVYPTLKVLPSNFDALHQTIVLIFLQC